MCKMESATVMQTHETSKWKQLRTVDEEMGFALYEISLSNSLL